MESPTKTISRLKQLWTDSVAKAIQHGQQFPFFKVNSFCPRLSDGAIQNSQEQNTNNYQLINHLQKSEMFLN